MSRVFEKVNSEYLSTETSPVTSAPLTAACWFRSGNITDRQCLMQICEASASNRWWSLELRGDSSDKVMAEVVGTGSTQKLTTTAYSANTWHHACATFSSTALAVLLDGGSKASGSHSRNPAGGGGVNRTAIGMLRDATPSRPLDGRVAEGGGVGCGVGRRGKSGGWRRGFRRLRFGRRIWCAIGRCGGSVHRRRTGRATG